MSLVKKLRVLHAAGRAVLTRMEPSYLILYVNNVCNLRCDMCLTWDRMQRRTDDLTREEFVKLARSFRNLVQLTITGGEPTLNGDVPAIVHAFYRHARLGKCTLVTNGTYTDRTLAIVEAVLDACPHLDLIVSVSLDGPKELHERIRGVPGCFDKSCRTLDGLAALRERRDNLSLGVTSVVSKYNWQHLHELYDLVRRRFPVDTHAFLLARGTTKESDAKDVPLEAYRAMREILDRDDHRSRQYLSLPVRALSASVRDAVARVRDHDECVVPCVAGRKLVEVYSNGDVVPCELIGEKCDPFLGNVRQFDYDIVKLLESARAQAMRSFIRDTRCRCTFECALYASLAFNPMQYPKVAAAYLRRAAERRPEPRAHDRTECDHPGLQPA